MESQEYHDAHLAFVRADIIEAAANRAPILDLIKAYTRDVIQAERDRIVGFAHSRAADNWDPSVEAALDQVADEIAHGHHHGER